MFYDFANDYINRTFKSEHVKNTALVLFNYMHNRVNYTIADTDIDYERAIETLVTVHDIAVFNCATDSDIVNIVDMYNQICNYYDSSKYRVLYHNNSMILCTETEYTKYVTDEIHNMCDVKAEYVF